jgi:hypothetical protein
MEWGRSGARERENGVSNTSHEKEKDVAKETSVKTILKKG